MPILDKAKVAVGLHSKSKLDLSHTHITTSNFMDMQPVAYRHMIPQESYKVNVQAFARLAPLSVPTYGRCRLNLRAFFVPFRTVMPKFNDFITDTVSSQYSTASSPNVGIIRSTPTISNSELLKLFSNTVIVIGGQSYSLTSAGTAASYDYYDGTTYKKFTLMGRRFFKILRSLGYNIIPNPNDQTVYSALALLAYLRVFYDWYAVSAYMDTNTYQLFSSWFQYDNPSTPLDLKSTQLAAVASFLMRVAYDGDYFTAAWDSPVSPNPSNYTQLVIPDVTTFTDIYGHGSYTSVGSNGTPQVSQTDSNNQPTPLTLFTQFDDQALHALTDYMKRHQLAGARTIDRYLADFGINLPADKLQRSTYLGMSTTDIRIGDVMSHSDTSAAGDPSNLGDYAGQGIAKGNKTFEYQAAEFGMFIIVSSILPTGGYVQGYDRNNLHVTKDQFFLPDFDNLGVQGIARGELYISNKSTFAAAGDYDGIFGYTPRYAEYKIARDQVTGDFALKTVLDGGDSWHLMRMFDDAYFGGSATNIQHDLDFCLGNDSDQYNRIFNNTAPDVDKFYIVYQFDASAYAPCQSLFDTYQFENESKEITLDANGVKMN